MNPHDAAALLIKLLPGLPGTLLVSEPRRDATSGSGKVSPSYRLDNSSLTPEKILAHFKGETRYGVCPIAAKGTHAAWGVLDIDLYGFNNYSDLLAVLRIHWPGQLLNHIVPYRTKSGGWHLFIIFDRMVDAGFIRDALNTLACWLPFPPEKIDRRPNQASLLLDKGDKGSRGTYVNLPLFGATPEQIEAFLSDAQRAIITEEWFRKILDEKDFADGPSCLFPLYRRAEEGTLEGSRNYLMYQLFAFWKKKYPETWKEHAQESAKVLGLPAMEIEKGIRYREKSKVPYICTAGPFPEVCNKGDCSRRKYGIRSTGTLELLRKDSLCKFTSDPPSWFVTLVLADGTERRMELETDQLLDPNRFRKRCMEEGNILPDLPKKGEWDKVVQSLLETVTILEVPPDATYSAQLEKRLYDFYTSSPVSTNADCLFRGMIWLEGDSAYFRISEFREFLVTKKRENVALDKLYIELDKLEKLGLQGGLCHIEMEHLGVRLNVWRFRIPEHLKRRSIEHGEA